MQYTTTIHYTAYNLKGESRSSSWTSPSMAKEKAINFLKESHEAAKSQDQKWILNKIGYPMMGPIKKIDFIVGRTFGREVIIEELKEEIVGVIENYPKPTLVKPLFYSHSHMV
jgi:hypothetical protein